VSLALLLSAACEGLHSKVLLLDEVGARPGRARDA
jgi:hypothetical protein